MHALTLVMIVVVTSFEFLTKGDRWGRWAILPAGSQYIAEILSVIVVAYVVVAGARNRFVNIRGAYWLIFGALLLTLIASALANSVDAGPIFAGVRSYLRAIPWFFLPAIYAFTDAQVTQQIRLLLLVCIVQLPLAVEQSMTTAEKLEQYASGYTGDWTYGSLMLSPALSIFLVSGICIAAGLLVRKQLAFWQFCLLFVAFLIPTAINETKATFIMLPMGVITAFIAGSKPGVRLRNTLGALLVATAFLAAAVPIYDYTVRENEWQQPIGEMLTDPDALERYLLYKEEVGTTRHVGKADTVVVSLRVASEDPVRFVFGHGVGNVSESALGQRFTGEYFHRYGPFTATTFGGLVLELGMLGLGLVLLLIVLIFRDALWVAHRSEGLRAGIAAGWAGVMIVFVLAIPYTDLIPMTGLSYLFWYFAGLVAADRIRLARQGAVLRPAR